MTQSKASNFQKFSIASLLGGLLILLPVAAVAGAAEPSPAAVAAFNAYTHTVELRLAQQHRSQEGFLARLTPASASETRLHQGELIIEQLTPPTGANLPGAMLHHWRGTAFIAGATATDFERLMRNFNAYPQHFFPQVLATKVLAQTGNRFQIRMRVRQHEVITVVMDTSYNVTFGRPDFARSDARYGYILSRSTRVSEIDSAGTAAERTLNADEEHGFLWRQNTYWSYEQRDGGVYMQIESVSLTRSIPLGLGWAVRPFVESVPRDSLEFTLHSVCNALQR